MAAQPKPGTIQDHHHSIECNSRSHQLWILGAHEWEAGGIMIGDEHGWTADALGLMCQHIAALSICVVGNDKACKLPLSVQGTIL